MKISEIKETLSNRARLINAASVSSPDYSVIPSTSPTTPRTSTATTPVNSIPAKSNAYPSQNNSRQASVSKTSYNNIEDIIAHELVPGIDYAKIPGCGQKPALLKAGAERLATLLHLHTASEIINRVEYYEKQFVMYEVKTSVFDEAGNIISVGLGSCNTKELKYRGQYFANTLNTVIKIARKRSYVDGILSATGSSRSFTQDIEEGSQGHLDSRELKQA